MLRIHRKADGDIVFALSGRIDGESIAELETLIGAEGKDRRIILDLKDMTLTGQEIRAGDAVRERDRREFPKRAHGTESIFSLSAKRLTLRWRIAIHTSASESRDKKLEASACWLDQNKNAERSAFIKD